MSLLEPVFSLLLGHRKQLTAWLQTQTSEVSLDTISLTIVILDFTVPYSLQCRAVFEGKGYGDNEIKKMETRNICCTYILYDYSLGDKAAPCSRGVPTSLPP